MLDIMRKHAGSWGIKIVLGLVIVVFVLWGGYAARSRQENSVAKVGDSYISVNQFNNAYQSLTDMYRKQFGKAFSEEAMKGLNLKHQALEALITRHVLMKSAEELGFAATPEEVQRKILDVPAFKNGGRFDQERYQAVLRQNRLTPEQFEQQTWEELTLAKTQNFIKARTAVSDDEVMTEYHFNNDRIRLIYALVEPKQFEDKVKADDEALQTFYNGNQKRYMEPEKRKISYVLFNAAEMAKTETVTEDEARRYYEDFQRQFHKEQEVKASHILFRLKPDASEAEVEAVRQSAMKVLDEAKKGKDFAQLAKKQSEDPASAKNGGDLGYFDKNGMDPAFTKTAFDLKPGEISDLVRTQFGFHIIKVGDVRPERTLPLEEVKGEIEDTLKRQRADEYAERKSRDLRDLAYAYKDIAKAAAARKIELTGTDMWIEQKIGQPASETFPIPAKPHVFDLKEGEVSDSIEVPQGVVVVQLKEIKAPQPMPFEQVKDQVQKDFRIEQAKVLARGAAEELLKLAKEKNGLDAAAKERKIAVKESGGFSRKEPDKEIRPLQPQELGRLFELQESKPLPDAPVEMVSGYMVCQLKGRTPADQPGDKEKADTSEEILVEKQNTLWTAWLQDQQKRVTVVIYKDRYGMNKGAPAPDDDW